MAPVQHYVGFCCGRTPATFAWRSAAIHRWRAVAFANRPEVAPLLGEPGLENADALGPEAVERCELRLRPLRKLGQGSDPGVRKGAENGSADARWKRVFIGMRGRARSSKRVLGCGGPGITPRCTRLEREVLVV